MSNATLEKRNVAKAEKLWSELRELFVNAEAKIKEIIETRAWEPLGYGSFAEAWNDRMAGVRLATDAARAYVVYALFDDGLDEGGVAAALPPGSGVGPSAIKALRRQRSNGVPADFAVVREHLRAKPGEPRYVHVELSPDEYENFKAIAEKRNLNFASESAKAVRAHFRKLEARR